MQTKIDCSIAENYIVERERMCESFRTKECDGCLINSESPMCGYWTSANAQKAVEIVQAWSDEHPIEPVVTKQDKFLETFPNALTYDGVIAINPCRLGDTEDNCVGANCDKCRAYYWSQPYKEDKQCDA